MFPIEIIPRLRDASALRYLTALERRAPALVGDVLQSWVPIVHGEIDRQFDVGGDPRWKANRPSTIAGKGHSRVLFGAGGDSNIKKTIYVIFRQSGPHGGAIFAGDRTSYGSFHQDGVEGTWLVPRNPDHPTYCFMIGNRWVTIARGRQIRHPGLPRRSFVVVGIKMSRMLTDTVWQQLRKFQ